MEEEWRVSLVTYGQPNRRKAEVADALSALLPGRADGEVSVTAGKAGIFLYAATADAAAVAEGAAREVLAERGLAAEIRRERWDPAGQAWLAAGEVAGEAADAGPPPPGQERDAGRRRLRAAGALIAGIIDGISSAP